MGRLNIRHRVFWQSMKGCAAIATVSFATTLRADDASSRSVFIVHPDKPQQVVWGLGFEIQSDSINSGNQGVSDALTSVPNDLVPNERDRFADEMLKGFRFCRLAGGLYWRGLDSERKHLQPRWPGQLKELQALLHRAGVESLSFEYWSPAPFWKGNNSYSPVGQDYASDVLRCFAPNFATDPVYKGNTGRFLADFAQAICKDIKTLEDNGLKVGFFGLQNEPWTHAPYAGCPYTVEQYGQTFRAVATAIRKLHPSVKIIADTGNRLPTYIAPVLADPVGASLVDYLVIHAIGLDSLTVADDVRRVRELVKTSHPIYQNEYEYLDGPASPARCINTVQNIMNWFQLGQAPTWYWLHALKPIGNAEASGYSLGFWRPTHETPPPPHAIVNASGSRSTNGARIEQAPNALIGLPCVTVNRGDAHKPGAGYSFTIDRPADVFLAVHQRGTSTLPPSWEKTDMKVIWGGTQTDAVYRQHFSAGKVDVPSSDGSQADGFHAVPHMAFVRSDAERVAVGTLPADLGTQVANLTATTNPLAVGLKPGHFTLNPYNWNSLVGFLKHMPWDSTVVHLDEVKHDEDRRVLAFKRPDGRLVVLLSNRSGKVSQFDVTTGLAASFDGFRYTAEDVGPSSMGQPLPATKDGHLQPSLPHGAWEFWVQRPQPPIP